MMSSKCPKRLYADEIFTANFTLSATSFCCRFVSGGYLTFLAMIPSFRPPTVVELPLVYPFPVPQLRIAARPLDVRAVRATWPMPAMALDAELGAMLFAKLHPIEIAACRHARKKSYWYETN